MTLYWYVHWFWITCHCYVVFCDMVNTPTHSITELTNQDVDRAGEIIGNFTISPPLMLTPANLSTRVPIKQQKLLKKSSNLTRKIMGSTTEVPRVKESAVIDTNVTDLSLNIIDNQTLINTTFNVINRTENLTYFEDDIKKIVLSNTEQIEKDGSENLSAAGITGITLGCVFIVGILSTFSYVLYKNRGFNRPQVLNDHCSNLDSSGYIDDTSVRDNSEEMYSLDNDSFLNSLEAMTIQNYWTDTVKHTKL